MSDCAENKINRKIVRTDREEQEEAGNSGCGDTGWAAFQQCSRHAGPPRQVHAQMLTQQNSKDTAEMYAGEAAYISLLQPPKRLPDAATPDHH